MKKYILILIFVLPFLGKSQVSIIDEKNGFRDIKFGSNVKDYSFVKKCQTSCVV